jgi:hypothetical protein
LIIAGYAFSFLGGFIGIFIGLHIYKSKKLIPQIGSFYSYSPEDRKHGLTITIVGIIMTITAIFIRAIIGAEQ